ncbi:hypothetical protein [Pseudomonas mandelii]|uniref:Uncharacterized protein n=1 Tax=Pseudomonas mandelii TaxID=75612 RepID=A0A502IF32_9PSED|nr:hypothetical protein [Pseudomonas mandelii]TPG84754.1 hypothetical protein EAH74_12060 [Pseudomonas mandelii]
MAERYQATWKELIAEIGTASTKLELRARLGRAEGYARALLETETVEAAEYRASVTESSKAAVERNTELSANSR